MCRKKNSPEEKRHGNFATKHFCREIYAADIDQVLRYQFDCIVCMGVATNQGLII